MLPTSARLLGVKAVILKVGNDFLSSLNNGHVAMLRLCFVLEAVIGRSVHLGEFRIELAFRAARVSPLPQTPHWRPGLWLLPQRPRSQNPLESSPRRKAHLRWRASSPVPLRPACRSSRSASAAD